MRHRHEVKQTSRCCNENVAPTLKLVLLLSLWRTTVRYARSQHGTIAETAGFIEDLGAQLTSGSNDQDQRLGADGIDSGIETIGQVWTTACQLLHLTHEFRDGRDQVGGGLSRT